VHCVFDESDWGAAVADAFGHGSRVLVEEFVEGRELTVGVVGGEALPVIEIVAMDGWYDYDAKYTKGRTEYVVPAEIGEAATTEAQRLALAVFEALGCEGVGRVDFILDKAGKLWVLELNSIPGFTETSLLPKAAASAGIDFVSLCDRIMRGAAVKRAIR
jgi:D-alanine-D-alanine ligase